MIIQLKKFGTILVSRQAGKEALAAFQPTLKDVERDELVEVDFEGVEVFTPSWGDEFLMQLLEKFKNNLILTNTKNPSVEATLDLLENIEKKKFIIKN